MKVITKIERVPIKVHKDATIKERVLLGSSKAMQNKIWRFVCTYFGKGNDCWQDIRKIVDDETVIEIEYNATSKEDAERELRTIKEEAFKYLGKSQIKRFKSKIKGYKKVNDDDPQFAKLVDNLSRFMIYLDVYIVIDSLDEPKKKRFIKKNPDKIHYE